MGLDTLIFRSGLPAAGRAAFRRLVPASVRGLGAKQQPIEQLVLSPQDLRTADPSFASEIYHGHFGLAGAVAMVGSESSPFQVIPPSRAWERNLHGFGWLRHLSAAGDEISREHARALVRDWLKLHGKPGGTAWQADLLSRRVISWLSHSRIFLENADQRFYGMVTESLTRQVRYLRANFHDAPPGAARLVALAALVFADLCTSEKYAPEASESRAFSDELNRQILGDGGHISRNPLVLIGLLLDLLPMRQCFIARDVPPPDSLIAAIDRMMPMIRFFRLGDGNLARFNGGGPTPTDRLAAVVAHDDVMGSPLTLAEQSGYCRLEQGEGIVLVDCGRPPPVAMSVAAHAGCLAFEMSSANHPIIVNCGAPTRQDADWRLAARASAAHSTLVVSDTSSSQLRSGGEDFDGKELAVLSGPANVTARVETIDGVQELRASHDGYNQRFGITHTRKLSLSASGETLTGIDTLIVPRGLKGEARDNGGEFAIRFHLHPFVSAELSNDKRTALLTLPNHVGWQLTSKSEPLAIEESVFLADNRGPRRAEQVVLYSTLGLATEKQIDWVLEKSAAGPEPDEKSVDDELLEQEKG